MQLKCKQCGYTKCESTQCPECRKNNVGSWLEPFEPKPEEANADEQISSVIGTLQNSVDNTFDGLQVHYRGKKMRKSLCGKITDEGENFIFTPDAGGQTIYNPSLKNLSFCNCR